MDCGLEAEETKERVLEQSRADTRERGGLMTKVTPHGLAFQVSGRMIIRPPLRDKLALKPALVAAEVQPMLEFHFQHWGLNSGPQAC